MDAGVATDRTVHFPRGIPRLRIAALTALLVLSSATAQEPRVGKLVETIRYAPRSKAAALAIDCLSRRGHAGWKALRAVVIRYADDDEAVARLAALALRNGRERERIAQVWNAYAQVTNEALRGVLALGLVAAYPERDMILHARLHDDEAGAAELLAALGDRGLPTEEAVGCLLIENLAETAYRVLRARGAHFEVEQLDGAARCVARRGLSPRNCRAFAAAFAAEPDFLLLDALAETLASEASPEVWVGAYCLLGQVCGVDLPPDRDPWRAWIAEHKAEYVPPAALSPGAIAAARARAVAYLRQDLVDDGQVVWQGAPPEAAPILGTSWAVLALRSAGVPADDPVLRMAVDQTLLIVRRGTRALPPVPQRLETASLSKLAAALHALGDESNRTCLQTIANRLAHGQLANGQWTHTCSFGPDNDRPASGQNWATQNALLGLRAARAGGAQVPVEIWQRAEACWRATTNPRGGWNQATPPETVDGRQVYATGSGLVSLAICIEGRLGHEAPATIRADPIFQRALEYLGSMLADTGLPRPLSDWYAVEGACALTGTRCFLRDEERFDWYARGVAELVRDQRNDGAWQRSRAGASVDTAHGLLFLTRATAPIGAVEGEVSLPAGRKMVAEPQMVLPAPPARPRTPLLRLDRKRVATRSGTAVIRGTVLPGAALMVDGRATELNADGRFAVPVVIEKARSVEVVATTAGGATERCAVHVEIDNAAPLLKLASAEMRHVGKQPLRFEASEPLANVWIDGRVFPADDAVVEAVAEIKEGRTALKVRATDLAGNVGRFVFPVEATNRVLHLDGRGAVFVPLPGVTEHFTLECWARGEEPKENSVVVGFAWDWSGASIHWRVVGWGGLPSVPGPHGILFLDGRYQAVKAGQPWRWEKWTHLALTYDGQAARFFVNGRLQAEVEGAKFKSVAQGLYVGTSKMGNGTFWRFKGEIDEVRLSGVPRYAKSFKPQKYFFRDPDTLLLLHFDTDTERAFFDDSGRDHHGRPIGNPELLTTRR